LAFRGLVKGHLKENTAVEIIKSDYIQILDIAFITGPFGVKLGCHRSLLPIQSFYIVSLDSAVKTGLRSNSRNL
jgi:hypothetical protein